MELMRVVMIEYTEKFDEKSIAVYDSVSDGRNVIQEGEDIAAGEVFMKKGSCVRPQEIGVMASAGVTEVEVFRPWEVTVISTGDELVVGGRQDKERTDKGYQYLFLVSRRGKTWFPCGRSVCPER